MTSLPEPLVQFRTDLEKAADRNLAAERRRRRRQRRFGIVTMAVLIVTVAAASALGTVSGIFGGSDHVYSGVFVSEGKRGTFSVHLMFLGKPYPPDRNWEIRSRPANFTSGAPGEPLPTAVPASGQYLGIRGGGQITRVGGHKDDWEARLRGFMRRPGRPMQRVEIVLRGRPDGRFTITPLEPGPIRADSGTQSSAWMG